MDSKDNIFDKIQELLGYESNNLNILEEQIDTELQTEYFDFAKECRTKDTPDDVLKNRHLLFDDTVSIENKKTILVQLASINKIEAYRTIEKFFKSHNNVLHKWAILAFNESKLLLESKLLDVNQVLISTGLGGKGLKLRYFVVFYTKDFKDINELQEKIIRNEVEHILNRNNAELEEIRFNEFFTYFITIIPLRVNIQNVFENIIDTINQYGNFLDRNFIITNMKKLTKEEVKVFITEYNKA